jgi:hypothetical protein
MEKPNIVGHFPGTNNHHAVSKIRVTKLIYI